VPRVTKAPAPGGDRSVLRDVESFPASLRVDPSTLDARETYQGTSYLVWHKQTTEDGPAGKYLVDTTGAPVFLVDPGINGVHRYTPDGQRAVAKFDAPKATLMSYIIKGILNRQLPWSLVLLGVMIAVVLELAGIPSLAFAVGVYLPLSSSSPLLAGGLVRLLADRQIRKRFVGRNLTEDELDAEGNKSLGVLLSSGYIAGGAIAGIVIAFMAGVLGDLQTRIEDWATANNPFFGGAHADALSMIPFVLLCALLYFTAIRNTQATTN
jgi:hypothetical protein